jgi:hypothetical protein
MFFWYDFRFFLKRFLTTPVAPIVTGIMLHFRFHIRCISIHKLLYFNFFSAFAQHFCLLVLPHYCYYYSNFTLAAQVYVMSGCKKCCFNCTQSQGFRDHVMKYFTFQNQFTKPTSTSSVFILTTQNGQWDMALRLTSHKVLRRNVFINMN